MIAGASIFMNGVLTLFVAYHLIRYGKGEWPLILIGCVYAAIVFFSLSAIVGTITL